MMAGVPSEDSLPLSAELRIDAVCQRFEAAWRAVKCGGARPVVEAYLDHAAVPERAALLRELLALDLDYRRHLGERPTTEEYRPRFPTHGGVIEQLFREQTPAAISPVHRRRGPEGADGLPGQDTTTIPPRLRPPARSPEGDAEQIDSTVMTGWPGIHGYEVLAELGRGGMGVVYKARQARPDRLVALKMILAGAHAGEEELARFRAEAEALARLQHPNFVQVYEVAEHDGLPYISLEFCAGGSLADRLDGTPLPPAKAAQLVEMLATAMHAAHRAGIVHRDLKPANVLLTDEAPLGKCLPKIGDFGLAKRLDGGAARTASGAVLGTPSYMAPEQAAPKGAVGPAADVYALGAILYELLTGRPPFKAATTLDTILQVVADEPVPVRTLQPRVPRDVETICLKCLQKDPAKRYCSAEELAVDLRKFNEGKPILARPVGRLEKAAKWAWRRPAAAALLAVSGLALLASVGGGVAGYYSSWLRDANTQLQGALEEAGQQRQRAENAELLARRRLYASDMNRAHQAWQDSLYPLMKDLLDKHGQDSAEHDLRGFEWYYLARLRISPDQLSLRGHPGPAGDAVFSPDGRRVAGGGGNGTVKVWDAETGQETLSLKGHTLWVHGVAWSPDGTRLASASDDKTVKVWDAQTGQEALSLQGHMLSVVGVAWSPDGARLASASWDQTVKVWDAKTRQEALTLKGHKGTVSSVSWSPDGTRLASACSYIEKDGLRGDVTLWDAGTGQEVLTLKDDTGAGEGVAFSPDGKSVASSGGGIVKTWNSVTGQQELQLYGHTGHVMGIAFSPDGQRLSSASADGTLKMWDVITGQETITLRGHQGRVFSVRFSADGQRLVSAGDDGTVRVWDARPQSKAVSEEEERIRSVRERMFQPIKFQGFQADPKMTLQEALDHFADRYGPFIYDVDEAAFMAEGLADVLSTPVAAPEPMPATLYTSFAVVLRNVLSRVPAKSGATYIIDPDGVIEITTQRQAETNRKGHPYLAGDVDKARELWKQLSRPVKFNGFEKDPNLSLGEVLDWLPSRFNQLKFDLDDAAFVGEGLVNVRSCHIAEQQGINPMNGVGMDRILRRILSRLPASPGATYLIRGDTIVITTRKQAKALAVAAAEPGPK
jgi:DNA-binding beta-propeller fold protein YncE/tRNA A-37 threonylcarbamoyl transferase component Bud32